MTNLSELIAAEGIEMDVPQGCRVEHIFVILKVKDLTTGHAWVSESNDPDLDNVTAYGMVKTISTGMDAEIKMYSLGEIPGRDDNDDDD